MSAETYSSTSTLLGVDLLVEGRRGALRSQNLRRVEELFSVSCSLLEPSQQGDWVRINGNSSQNLENAKVRKSQASRANTRHPQACRLGV